MLTDNPNAPLILLVEDDASHAELMKSSLQDAEEEYRLEIIGTLCAARSAIERETPNLVLTDYRLPDGDGSELVATVKGLCPVVMTTSHGNEQVAVDAMKGGALDYVVKTPEVFFGMSRIVQRGLREWALIQERKRAEEEKWALEQQLQQARKLESLGVLAGGIAHDFNNILAIIAGNCYLAKLHPETAESNISTIEKASERAALLCRQMLEYAGKAQFEPTKVNMTALLDETVKMLKATINKNVVINLDLSSDVPSITGDAGQLRQIIMNLIVNASEAIGEAQGQILVSLTKIAVKARQKERDHLGNVIATGLYICLEVSDTGCGMDDETQRRIFEPFYTTKFVGRGLGMSAVLGIIVAHAGALQLTSQPGQGTTIKVYLPTSSDSEE